MRRVQYEQALVIYIDILGFQQLIDSRRAGEISRTIRLVRDAVKPLSPRGSPKTGHRGSLQNRPTINR